MKPRNSALIWLILLLLWAGAIVLAIVLAGMWLGWR